MSEFKREKDVLNAHHHALAEGADAGSVFARDAKLHGAMPIGEIAGGAGIALLWARLRRALPDMERRDLLSLAGRNLPDARVEVARAARIHASMAVLQGTFREPLFGIPPTGGVVSLRICEAHVLERGLIRESWFMPDFLDLMRQAGVWPLGRSLGAEGAWQSPKTGAATHAGAEDTAAMDLVLKMHAALLAFDGVSLDSMPHADYWTSDFMWYGPAGIGTTRGLEGFRAHHQIPFLRAFPDRKGAGHYIRVSDGDFAVTGGWPSVTATHAGPFLGLPPTQRSVSMRVMDFYRTENGRIAENWVPIDIPHLMQQMGLDVFDRMAELIGARRRML
ncbi:MAG: ester cyclase [Pseudomonadota bacterium]